MNGIPLDAAAPYANALTTENQPSWPVLFMRLTCEFVASVYGTKGLHRYAFPFDLHRNAQHDRNLPWDPAWNPVVAQHALGIRGRPHGLELPTDAPTTRARLDEKKRSASDAAIAASAAAGADAATQAAAGATAYAAADLSKTDFAILAEDTKDFDTLTAADKVIKLRLLASTPASYRAELVARLATTDLKSYDQMTSRDVYLDMHRRFVQGTPAEAAALESEFHQPFSAEDLSSLASFQDALWNKEMLLKALPEGFTKTFKQVQADLISMINAFPLGENLVRIHGDSIGDLDAQSFASLREVARQFWVSKAEFVAHDHVAAAAACARHVSAKRGTGPAGKVYMVNGVVDTETAHAAAAAAAAEAGKKKVKNKGSATFCFGCGADHAGGGAGCSELGAFIKANGNVYDFVKRFNRDEPSEIAIKGFKILLRPGFLKDIKVSKKLSDGAKLSMIARKTAAKTKKARANAASGSTSDSADSDTDDDDA